jgi:deoxyribodipyrimidine photo-lyase
LPELPIEWVRKLWEIPNRILADAGIVLGKDYPEPIVDHRDARLRALEALQQIKK